MNFGGDYSMNVNEVIFRAKNLKCFEVETVMPEDFEFCGSVPFDMMIAGRFVTAKVWAIDRDEAKKKLNEFFGNEYYDEE